jgi:valyl-tRNA synthetase
MSKTRGNVLDPLEVIEEIGADALRFALVVGTSAGADQRLTRAKLDGARNFSNKLWNVARFVLSSRPEPMASPSGDASLAERWIRSRLAATIERATATLDGLDLGAYVSAIYDFAWSDYCDWFVELAKVELRREDATAADRARVWRTAAGTLADILRLLHPIMPFITEAIWESLRATDGEVTGADELLITSPWPQAGGSDIDAEGEFDELAELIRAIRNARLAAGMPAGKRVPLDLQAEDEQLAERAERGRRYVEALARVQPLTVRAPGGATAPTTGIIPTPFGPAWLQSEAPGADVAVRRSNDTQRLEQAIARLKALLDNSEFTSKAPAAVVDRERSRLRELEGELRQLGG